MEHMTGKFDPALIAGIDLVAGVDEAGRGAWAGPVMAAAVILPRLKSVNPFSKVRDSKQLTSRQRYQLEPLIKRHSRAWAVGAASSQEIDTLGILPATRLAMTRALLSLTPAPLHILIDALFLPEIGTPQSSLLKGDQRSLSIAAASILAKTARDRWMDELSLSEGNYGFERHKGYGTRLHQTALELLGPCSAHRFSYKPVRNLTIKNGQ